MASGGASGLSGTVRCGSLGTVKGHGAASIAATPSPYAGGPWQVAPVSLLQTQWGWSVGLWGGSRLRVLSSPPSSTPRPGCDTHVRWRGHRGGALCPVPPPSSICTLAMGMCQFGGGGFPIHTFLLPTPHNKPLQQCGTGLGGTWGAGGGCAGCHQAFVSLRLSPPPRPSAARTTSTAAPGATPATQPPRAARSCWRPPRCGSRSPRGHHCPRRALWPPSLVTPPVPASPASAAAAARTAPGHAAPSPRSAGGILGVGDMVGRGGGCVPTHVPNCTSP